MAKEESLIKLLKQIEPFEYDISKAPISIAEEIVEYYIADGYDFVKYEAIGGESILFRIKRDNKFYLAKFARPIIYKGMTYKSPWLLRKFSSSRKIDEKKYDEDSYRFVDGCDIQSQLNSILSQKALGNYGYVPYVVSRGRGNILYYIMEYVEAKGIMEWTQRANKKDRLDFFHSLVCLVHYLFHRHGIIHRDLKFDNVLVAGNGSGSYKPVVIDFGICKNISVKKQIPTGRNRGIGSPLFGSPEQLNNLKSTDYRSDVFMLGTLLWVIWCGRIPKIIKSRKEIENIWEFFPPGDLPYELQNIYELCTRKDPIERYQEIGELQRDLEQVVLPKDSKVIHKHTTKIIKQQNKTTKVKGVRHYSMEEIRQNCDKEEMVEPLYNIINGFIRLLTKGNKTK